MLKALVLAGQAALTEAAAAQLVAEAKARNLEAEVRARSIAPAEAALFGMAGSLRI
ncbi:MAG TPA: hypothetical protein VFR21_20020 [Bradyrhizobium sp.]|nr:hypothetical protein [Bradyrhizobium sp.]